MASAFSNLKSLLSIACGRLSFKVVFVDMFFFTKAVVWRCSIEKVFLEVLQNSLENTSARVSFLIKLQTFLIRAEYWDLRIQYGFGRPATVLKKRLWHRCFSVNFIIFQLIWKLISLRVYFLRACLFDSRNNILFS